MSHNEFETDTEKQLDQKMGQLIQHHGKRLRPDDLMSRRAYKNVHAHWQKNLQQQRSANRTRWVSLAAAVVFMVTAGIFIQMGKDDKLIFAPSLYGTGSVFVANTSSETLVWEPLIASSLLTDSRIKTGSDSFLSLNLPDQSQLRLNSDTEIQLLDPSHIKLIRGEVYHDSDLAINSQPLSIQTNYGEIQHIGTRYKVKLMEDQMQLSVRNGKVQIENNNGKKQLSSGLAMEIDLKGFSAPKPVSSFDNSWKWTQKAAKPFNTQSQSLFDFISWYAHENGYQVEWNHNKEQTRRVLLSGKLQNIADDTLIKAVFLSTKFDYEINAGILSIH